MKKRWFGKKVVSVILSAALATGGWMMPVSAGAAELTDGLLLHYDFSADSVEGTTVTDLSGNDRNGTIYGAAVQEGILKLAGSADYVEMPAVDWSGYDAITISMDLKPEQEYSNLFAYNFGRNDVAAANAQSGYMFLNPSRPNERTARFALTQTNYEQETEVRRPDRCRSIRGTIVWSQWRETRRRSIWMENRTGQRS